jgi:hypothetical protein
LFLRFKEAKMSKAIKDKVIFSNVSDPFIIKKCDNSIAGFGQNVWRVIDIETLKLVCYINDDKNIYLPSPISFESIHNLMKFIQDYNLAKVCSKVV